MWCGVDVLGPEIGLSRITGANQVAQFAKVQSLLHCPAQPQDPNAALTITNAAGVVCDYTYNQNMGDPFGTQLAVGVPKFPCVKLASLRPDLILITELHPYPERGKNELQLRQR